MFSIGFVIWINGVLIYAFFKNLWRFIGIGVMVIGMVMMIYAYNQLPQHFPVP